MRRAALVAVLAAGVAGAALAEPMEPLARLRLPDGVRFRGLALSGDGAHAAVRCGDDRARVYALPSGELERTIETGPSTRIALSSDGRWLAAGTAAGAVTMRATADAGAAPRQVAATGARITDLVFSPDDALLVVGSEGAPLELREVATGAVRATLRTDFGGTAAVAFSSDGRLVATADEDTHVRVYDTAAGRQRTKVDVGPLEPFSLDFTPDGKTLVVAGAEKTLQLVDVESGALRRRLAAAPDPVGAVAVLAGGKTAAAAYFHAEGMSKPAPILVWDLDSGESRPVAKEIRVAGGGVTRDRRLLVATVDGGTVVVSTVR